MLTQQTTIEIQFDTQKKVETQIEANQLVKTFLSTAFPDAQNIEVTLDQEEVEVEE